MIAALKTWWHNRRYVICGTCGREFRKGDGGGLSGEIVCSQQCWAVEMVAWFSGYSGGSR